jgi:hypothetical protein
MHAAEAGLLGKNDVEEEEESDGYKPLGGAFSFQTFMGLISQIVMLALF